MDRLDLGKSDSTPLKRVNSACLRGCVIQLHLARHSKTMFRLEMDTHSGRRHAGRQAGTAIPILFPFHFLASKLGRQKEKREGKREGNQRTNERTRLHKATPPPPLGKATLATAAEQVPSACGWNRPTRHGRRRQTGRQRRRRIRRRGGRRRRILQEATR